MWSSLYRLIIEFYEARILFLIKAINKLELKIQTLERRISNNDKIHMNKVSKFNKIIERKEKKISMLKTKLLKIVPESHKDEDLCKTFYRLLISMEKWPSERRLEDTTGYSKSSWSKKMNDKIFLSHLYNYLNKKSNRKTLPRKLKNLINDALERTKNCIEETIKSENRFKDSSFAKDYEDNRIDEKLSVSGQDMDT
jgi:hypothetical protein